MENKCIKTGKTVFISLSRKNCIIVIIKLADECCLQTAAVNMIPPKVLTGRNFTKFSAVFVFFQKVLVGT